MTKFFSRISNQFVVNVVPLFADGPDQFTLVCTVGALCVFHNDDNEEVFYSYITLARTVGALCVFDDDDDDE